MEQACWNHWGSGEMADFDAVVLGLRSPIPSQVNLTLLVCGWLTRVPDWTWGKGGVTLSLTQVIAGAKCLLS